MNRRNISFKSFNGVSFEWALTHRSFPRILPGSSNFLGVILKFISKFDVRMSYHQSNAFLQDLSNSFHRWFNLSNFHSGVPQQLSWWFSSSFSTCEDQRRVSLKSWSILLKIHSSSLCHPLIIVFDYENSFHPSGAFHELFPFLSSEGHHVIIHHSQLSALVLQILPVHHSSII